MPTFASTTQAVGSESKRGLTLVNELLILLQRQTVISQFYQLDRLVVEGQKTVSIRGTCL